MKCNFIGTKGTLRNFDYYNPILRDVTLEQAKVYIESLKTTEEIELRINHSVPADKKGYIYKDIDSSEIYYWIHFWPSAPKG